MTTRESIIKAVLEIEKPQRIDDIKKLKKMGCTETKNSCVLVVPSKFRAVKTTIVVPEGGFCGCDYITIKYEVFNKKNKLVCTIFRSEDGDGSFQETTFL